MRLARLGPPGAERPAASLDDQTWTTSPGSCPTSTGPCSRAGFREIAAAVRAGGLPRVDEGERFGPPLGRPGKIVCVGLNYRDHAAETGAAIPPEPILFLKTPDTVVGPHDTVLVPRGSTKTDYEVELAVVIGRTARYLDSPTRRPRCIAGYAISHDVSEREFQTERGGQWDKGKNCETFNPLGPWIRTADEVARPAGARTFGCGSTATLRQDGTTADMIFRVAPSGLVRQPVHGSAPR